jgi:urease accessory protein
MLRFIQKTDAAPEPATTLTLPWEARTRSRLRTRLDNGEEAGLFLQRGTVLRGGDLLISDQGVVIRVSAADELLSIVSCDDALHMARACYHLGNRHTMLEITAGEIRYLHDPVLDRMVQGLGLEVRRATGPFEPELGAYGGHEHAHE